MDKQTQHTPGPWELDTYPDIYEGFRIRMGSSIPYTGINRPEHVLEWDPGVYPAPDGESEDTEHEQYLEAEANARRIVAAVNAVEGIPTEALESGAMKAAIDSLGQLLTLIKEGDLVDPRAEPGEVLLLTGLKIRSALDAYLKLRGDADA